jgi:enoyl-CoA hydratase/carnithine racemase
MDQPTLSNAVIWRVDERGVAYITLNRPQVYNAYNGDLIAALLIALDKARRRTFACGRDHWRGAQFPSRR